MTARKRLPHVTPATLDAQEAAAYVGLGIVLFRAAIKGGEIAYINDGGALRCRAVDLDAYLERKRQPAAWECMTATVTSSKLMSLPMTGTNVLTGQPRGRAR